MFTGFTGVCCNFAADALWSLYGDYEANGLIMMSGQMGHVINWFYENGQYYVIDFMCVAEDWEKIYEQYSSNAGKYVEDLVGRGKDLKSAFEDYYAKNPSRNWYYNNAFIYATDATGYDFY